MYADVAGNGKIEDSTPCSQMLTEKEWAPFRSFLILCDLHIMKFAGQLELIATDTENVFEAVMTLSRTAFDADDVERISVIFDASESFTILHARENAFTLCATYSFT